MVLALTFLLATSSAASAQFAPSKENLRGLKGVRLMVMLANQPHRLDEAEWPELLKMVQADAIAKLQEADIPLSQSKFVDEIGKAGDPRLVIIVPMDERDSSVSLTTEVKLLQLVRLSRDLSIETHAVTWSQQGSVYAPKYAPKPRDLIVRQQIDGLIDQFIQDYLSVNPKQSANSTKQKSK